MVSLEKKQKNCALLCLLPGLILFTLLVWKFNWVCDDAFISFRYAKHLALGEGLRYNLGAHTPVEGYSNFLWTVWLALFECLRLDVTVWARISSIACGAFLLGYVVSFARRRLALPPLEASATGLFFAALPPVAVWSTGGLESMAACLLVFALFERLLGDPDRPRTFQAAVLAVLLGLVRGDGAGYVAVILTAGFLTWLVQRRAGLLKALAAVFILFALAMAIHTAWRHGYYSDLVPNTAHIKTGLSWMRLERGLNYVVSLLLTVPSILLVLITALLPRCRPSGALAVQALLVIGANGAYAMYVGGDFMAMGRFLLPMMPFSALLFAGALKGLGRERAVSAVGLSAGALVLSLLPSFDLHPVPRTLREAFQFRWSDAQYRTECAMWQLMKQNTATWTRLGKALKQCTRPGESIVLGPIGAQGYYSDLFVYDIYGLTNRSVAKAEVETKRMTPGHDRYVPITFFLNEKPTYLAAIMVEKGYAEKNPELLTWWQNLPISQYIEIVTHPLPSDPDKGYGTNQELMLLRYNPP